MPLLPLQCYCFWLVSVCGGCIPNMKAILIKAALFVILGLPSLAASADMLPDAGDKPSSLSVEDNMRVMDINHDGMVSVSEIRTYLEMMHGKNYEQPLLDMLEAKATGKSCASPFTRSFY